MLSLLPFLLDDLPLAVGPVVDPGGRAPRRTVVLAVLVRRPRLRRHVGKLLLLAVDRLMGGYSVESRYFTKKIYSMIKSSFTF